MHDVLVSMETDVGEVEAASEHGNLEKRAALPRCHRRRPSPRRQYRRRRPPPPRYPPPPDIVGGGTPGGMWGLDGSSVGAFLREIRREQREMKRTLQSLSNIISSEDDCGSSVTSDEENKKFSLPHQPRFTLPPATPLRGSSRGGCGDYAYDGRRATCGGYHERPATSAVVRRWGGGARSRRRRRRQNLVRLGSGYGGGHDLGWQSDPALRMAPQCHPQQAEQRFCTTPLFPGMVADRSHGLEALAY